MKTAVVLALAAAWLGLASFSASAQIADKRSFMHPLGVWSNKCFVAQKRVYPRFHYSARYPEIEYGGEGGWVLHERNW